MPEVRENMKQPVIIKSSKFGITLMLNSELPFSDLMEEIIKKFHESERFFANSSFAISFEGRELSEEEKCRIVDTIMTDTTVKILCILENDEIRDAVITQKQKEVKEREMRAADPQTQAVPRRMAGAFYCGSLKPGEQVETDESIVIVGDVPKGARVVSKSSIVVLGSLCGSAFAGMDGTPDSFIAALHFLPEHYNIAGIYGSPAKKEKSSLFSSRNKPSQAKIAEASEGIIHIRPLYRV